MTVDLHLLERWLTGWSLARGLPLPEHLGGGLVVEVGRPEQLRRHVFVEAGRELQERALHVHEPCVYLKAAVDTDAMRLALPERWKIEEPGYFMYRPEKLAGRVSPPAGFAINVDKEHGAFVVRILDASGEVAAIGRVALNRGTAVFDRIETLEPYRRRGLGTVLMCELDVLAEQAGASERLLVATAEGRELYLKLGWQVLTPYSTAVLRTP